MLCHIFNYLKLICSIGSSFGEYRTTKWHSTAFLWEMPSLKCLLWICVQDVSCVLCSLLFSSPFLIIFSLFLGFSCLCLYSLPDPFFPTLLSFVPVYYFFIFFLIYGWMKAELENERDPVCSFHCTCDWRMMVEGGERLPCPAFPLLYLADLFT